MRHSLDDFEELSRFRPRVRQLPDRVELELRDIARRSPRGNVIWWGTLAAFLASLAWGGWWATLTLGALVVLSLRPLGGRLLGGVCVERLVVTDTLDESSVAPGGGERVAASDVERLLFRFRFPHRKPRSGRFEWVVDLQRLGPRLLHASSVHGVRRGLRQAESLAQRWNVPIELETRTLRLATRTFRPNELSGWLVFSLPPLILAAVIAYQQLALLGWPATEATIVAFEHEPAADWDGHWFAYPRIEYEYTLGGVQYVSTGWNPSPFHYQSRAQFARDAAGFVPGAKIRCWYHSRDPAKSYVVNRGVTTAPWVLAVTGACFAAASAWHCIATRQLHRIASQRN